MGRRAVIVGLACLLLAACSEGGSSTGPTATGENPPPAEYFTLVDAALADINDFWTRMMPAGYQPPVISGGYGSAVDGPVCAGDPALEGNAFYCPSGDFLAWDEPGLLVPIFLEVGDMAVAFILAHEWAHAIQQRAGFSYKFTIQAELQADCYAGAWAADAKGRGIVEPGDLDEVIQGLFLARDIPGRPWFDEQAHGSGFQRVRAFNFGFDNGAAACNAYIVSGPE